MYSTSQEDKFEWLKKESSRVITATPCSRLLQGVDFQIYLRENEAKIKNLCTLVCGPQDVLYVGY